MVYDRLHDPCKPQPLWGAACLGRGSPFHSLSLMDQAAVTYFVQKFRAFDEEELGDLVARRSGLSDEAIEALDRVLLEKGLKDSDVFAIPQPTPQLLQEQQVENVERQTEASRALWRGGLATTCKWFLAITFAAPVQIFLKFASIGALWALLILPAGYFGYLVGHAITKNTCANAEISLQAKKKNLWIMFAVLFPIYFVVYAGSHAVFSRG